MNPKFGWMLAVLILCVFLYFGVAATRTKSCAPAVAGVSYEPTRSPGRRPEGPPDGAVVGDSAAPQFSLYSEIASVMNSQAQFIAESAAQK